MTLQTERLTMIGLGVIADVPPDAVQPKLVDGVHLRWMCDSDLGFPWFGFHLYRRPALDGKPRCLGDALAQPPAAGTAGPWVTAVGTLGSDVALAFTEDFPTAGRKELDLRQRQWARLTLPAGQPAYRADVTIGLRQDVGQATKRTCVDFRTWAREPTGPNPRTQDGVGFTVKGPQGEHVPNTVVRPFPTSTRPLSGLDCGFELEIRIPCPAVEVELILTSVASPAHVRALNGKGVTVAGAALSPPRGQTQTLVLKGTGIVSVVVSAREAATVLHQVCFRCPVDSPTAGKGVDIVGLSGRTPVASATVTGAANQVVTLSLRFDELTAIEVRGGPAALVDICVWFVADGAAAGWQRLNAFPSPMGLPVRHPAYPATGNQPANATVAEGVGLARVKCGLPTNWQGQPFTDLHGQLAALVSGGPSGPSMASRAQTLAGGPVPAEPNAEPVQLADQAILDLLLLASLNPALAQILGVYWVDETAVPGVAYDYLVVADHSGVGQRDAQKVLAVIASTGFTQLDGWITFGLRASPAVPVGIPTGLEAYSLPDADIAAPDPLGHGPGGHGTVGLRWSLPAAVDGGLMPGAPVLYHLWRAWLDNQSAPTGTGPYDHVTVDGPVLVTAPIWAAGASPPPPADLPPFPLHAVDGGLKDGWYAYALCGVDLFGRHSSRSALAVWRQWAPVPQPRPWYYTDPPADRVVHPSAIRVLDKSPPPPPLAVEAYALDPLDPTAIHDVPFDTWRASLKAAEKQNDDFVGLRVTWRWTAAQMRQAPDTAEFRIYFNLGTDPPIPDSHEPTSWAERRYVVRFNEHVTVTQDADGDVRTYEVLLPAGIDTVRESLPLLPTLRDPIAYAHVGVSAADGQVHTADNPKWATGHWGGRPGNEGRVGPLAKVWRVWRKKPPPPVVPVDAERVFATRADYHSRSYYTFRWTASPHLKTHVFRAMDESLYRTDWALRPRSGPLAELRFPDPAADPRWSPAKRQQVAGELSALDEFDRTPDGLADAMTHYRGLSNDALRVLASMPGMEEAFAQITIEPLDPGADPGPVGVKDRPGPDNPITYVPRADLRVHIDPLDGRSTNRYFYRAAYVDAAHNRGPLSLSGPPVWLHKVVPPRPPVVHSIAGQDRAIVLTWNMAPGASRALVYRTEDRAHARDVRLMGTSAADLPAEVLVVRGGDVALGTDTGALVADHLYLAEDLAPGIGVLDGTPAPDHLVIPRAIVGGHLTDVDLAEGSEVVVVYRDGVGQLQHTPVPGRPLRWCDGSRPGSTPTYYLLVAVEEVGNEGVTRRLMSAPSAVAVGSAYDVSPPPAAQWLTVERVRIDSAGIEHPLQSAPVGSRPGIRLAWTGVIPPDDCLLQRRTEGGLWMTLDVLAARSDYRDEVVEETVRYWYRIKVRRSNGYTNDSPQVVVEAVAQ